MSLLDLLRLVRVRLTAPDGVGVSGQAILNAFRNPSRIEYVPSSRGPSFRLTGNDAVVVVNPQGQVVTTWARNSSGVRGQ